MKRKLAKIMILFSLFIFVTAAATVSIAYDGSGHSACECGSCGDCPQGQTSMSTTIINPLVTQLADHVYVSAESYNGVQYLSSDGVLMASDSVNFYNGCASLHQAVSYNYDTQSTLTSYNTVALGSGSASSYVVAAGPSGYSIQDALVNGSAYAGFTQQQYLDGQFQYEVEFASGANKCGYGEVYVYGYYDSGYLHALMEPFCIPIDELGRVYVLANANATHELHANSSLRSDSVGWFSTLDANGSAVYNTLTESNGNIDYFNTTIGVK